MEENNNINSEEEKSLWIVIPNNYNYKKNVMKGINKLMNCNTF